MDALGIIASAQLSADTGGGGGGYVAKAVHFDLPTYLSATALSGSPVSSVTMSFWIYVRHEDATNIPYITRGDGTNEVGGIQGEVGFTFSSNDIGFGVGDALGNNNIWWSSDVGAIAYDQWHHVFTSTDTSGSEQNTYLYVDGVSVNVPANGGINGALPFLIGFNGGTGFPAVGGEELPSLADVWLGYGQFLTPSDISKFRDPATGKPVDLGANGETPTGISPTIFFSGNAASFGQPNLGTGGAFTLTGSLTNATTSPSD